MGMKGKLDITHSIEKKRLQWYGHVKRMPEERIPKLTLWRRNFILNFSTPSI
jgi:hypothetical protein